jgi:hypothetical protein
VGVLHIRIKAKHSRTETFQVAGWRPSTSSRPGGLILAEDDDPIAVATLANRTHLVFVAALVSVGIVTTTGAAIIQSKTADGNGRPRKLYMPRPPTEPPHGERRCPAGVARRTRA